MNSADRMLGQWTLEVPPPDGKVYNSNHDHDAHRWEVHRRRKDARQVGAEAARYYRIPSLGRAVIDVTIAIKAWRRADPGNYPGGSTLKGMIDGLVDAGVVTDDRQEFLDLTMPRLVAQSGPWPLVTFTIRPWESDAA